MTDEPFTGESRPRPAQQVAAVRDGAGVLVADLRASRLHSLQGAAAEIWPLLDGNTSLATITVALSAAHSDVSPALLADHVLAFAEALRESRLVADAATLDARDAATHDPRDAATLGAHDETSPASTRQ